MAKNQEESKMTEKEKEAKTGAAATAPATPEKSEKKSAWQRFKERSIPVKAAIIGGVTVLIGGIATGVVFLANAIMNQNSDEDETGIEEQAPEDE